MSKRLRYPLALLVLGAGLMTAQDTGAEERLRSLQERLVAQSTPDLALVRERALALKELARTNPRQALSLLLDDSQRLRLLRSLPAAAPWVETRGEWRGRIESSVADDFESGTHFFEHTLITADNRRVRVHSADHLESVPCQTPVTVRGYQLDNEVLAASHQTDGRADAASPCLTTGEQRSAVVLVKFPSSPAPAQTVDQIRNDFFSSTGESLNTYWREVSYDRAWAAGDVFGWYTLSENYTCDQTEAILNAAIAQIDPITDLREYKRIFILFTLPANCPWSGLGTVGCRNVTSPRFGQLPASVVWQAVENGWGLAAHEGGHSLGILHANLRAFPGTPLGAPGVAGDIQYMGDTSSVMGAVGYFGHYSARHKLALGWLDAASQITNVEGEGTFQLSPIAAAGPGLKALRVRRSPAIDAWIWIEYRKAGTLYDRDLLPAFYDSALIHYEDSQNAGSGAFDTHLLDFAPGTGSSRWADFQDAPLRVGGRWSDANGDLTIEALSADAAGLTVRVTRPTACFTLSATSVTASPAASTITVPVTAPSGCAWSASTGTAWLTIQAGSGSGSGSIVLQTAMNPASTTRVGEVIIGSRILRVVQPASRPVIVGITPSSGEGRSQTFQLTASDPRGFSSLSAMRLWFQGPFNCVAVVNSNATAQLWDPVSGAVSDSMLGLNRVLAVPDCALDLARSSWEVRGNQAVVTFAMEFRSAPSGTATLSVNAWDTVGGYAYSGGHSWTVPNTARECVFSLIPNPIQYPATAGILNLQLQSYPTAQSCPWTLGLPAWMNASSPVSGSGDANLLINVAANPGAPRMGSITAGSQTLAFFQNGPSPCSATITPPQTVVAASGRQNGVAAAVLSGSCPWQAGSNDSWIQFPSLKLLTGNSSFAYRVEPNRTGSPRTGVIQFAGTVSTFTVTQQASFVADRIGIYSNGEWVMDLNGNGLFDGNPTDKYVVFGASPYVPVVGDWGSTAVASMGIFSAGYWYLDQNQNRQWDGTGTDRYAGFGAAGWTAISGDWNGDGRAKIGVFRDGSWLLDFDGDLSYNASRDRSYTGFGGPGALPVVGDWNLDGRDEIGVYVNGYWYLDYDGDGAYNPANDKQAGFGAAGFLPVIGDWNGDGRSKIGIVRNGEWYVDFNGNFLWEGPVVDRSTYFGATGWLAVVGDWNADGKTEIGVFRDGQWYLDHNGNYQLDGADKQYTFGAAGQKPIVGKW